MDAAEGRRGAARIRTIGASTGNAGRGIVSVELVLDTALEERVIEDWRRLAEAGMSSLAAHASPSNRPHVTLLVRPTLEPVPFAASAALLPISLTLGEPMLFRHGGDRGVLVRPVLAGNALTHVHRCLHAEAGPGEDAPHTAFSEWTPHVTLARRLKVEALETARAFLPPLLRGHGVSLRRWDSATATVKPLP